MLTVSVIVPCYNEEKTIAKLLGALLAQKYPRAQMEVIISDGNSQDGTHAAIAAFCAAHPDLSVRVVSNEGRTIPAALNLALAEARGEYIIRLDAHSMPHPQYIATSLRLLEEGKGANVGGVWEILPGGEGWLAEAIAAAAAHPLGVGDAKYRYTDTAGPVDTVPFGAFRKALVAEIGHFDETLLANEDYEFNARIRRAGYAVYLDPEIRAVYFARASLGALAQQYARYGFWKTRMLARYPATLRWRQALPPLFIAGLLGGALALPWLGPLLPIYLAGVVSYLLALFVAGVLTAVRERKPLLALGMPLAIATMHIAWGSAFWWGLFTLASAARPTPRS